MNDQEGAGGGSGRAGLGGESGGVLPPAEASLSAVACRWRRQCGGGRWIVALVMGLVVGAASGCGALEFKGGDGRAVEAAAAAEDWPFKPARMRVHPFTSIDRDEASGDLVLEARVELLDPMGDPTKGVGDFRFELYAEPRQASRAGEGRRLAHWRVPMRTVEKSGRFYDPITRTYSFKLKLEEPPPREQRLELVAQLTMADGQRLRGEAPIEREAGSAPDGRSEEEVGGRDQPAPMYPRTRWTRASAASASAASAMMRRIGSVLDGRTWAQPSDRSIRIPS